MAATLGNPLARSNSPCGLCTHHVRLHRAPDRHICPQAADLHRCAGVWRLDDEVVAYRQLHMSRVGKTRSPGRIWAAAIGNPSWIWS